MFARTVVLPPSSDASPCYEMNEFWAAITPFWCKNGAKKPLQHIVRAFSEVPSGIEPL